MKTKSQCDPIRVDRFLESNSYQLEDPGLIEHLESCAACRDYIAEQAASEEAWQQVRELLCPGEYDRASTAEYSLAGVGENPLRQPLAIQDVLSSLAPSDYPQRLGRLGTYEITGVIGVGGMGVVLKAIDPSLDRVVAVKAMAPQLAHNEKARMRFSREAKAAAAVLHPNVIPIHSVASDGKIPYLVMAYVRGGSLQDRLEKNGPLPVVEILRIGLQLAAGLAAAHEQGLVHRDIKPANILLEEGVERVTITDFGLARSVDDNTVTQQGTIAGTPTYMSPEQARGEKVDQKSDLFSLGSVLYALCTGRPPYVADTSYGVMRRIIDEQPRAIRELNADIPDWLANLISGLMAKERKNRIQSASETHRLLELCLNHVQQPDETELPNTLLTSFTPNPKRRHRVMKTLALLAVLSLAGILATETITQDGSPQKQVQQNEGAKDPSNPEKQQGTQFGVQENREATAKVEPTLKESVAAKNALSDPNATWASLGLKHLDGYSTDEISLLRLMDQSRGKWIFICTAKGGETQTVVEAEVTIRGGFHESLKLHSPPAWQIEMQYSLDNADQVANASLMAIPDKGRLSLMVSRQYGSGTRGEVMQGEWNKKSLTLTASEQGIPDEIKQRYKHVKELLGNGVFQISFSKTGSITFKETLTTADGQEIEIHAISQYKMKSPLALYAPPAPLQLPEGFSVFVADSTHIALQGPDVSIEPNVTKLGTNGDLIFGFVEKYKGYPKYGATPGYFVLNAGKKDADLKLGLSQDKWAKELRKRGISEPPELVNSRSVSPSH